MAYTIPADELGDLRCSDLDVPMFQSIHFDRVVTPFLMKVTEESWNLIADGQVDPDTVDLVSDLCNAMLNSTIASVLDVVAPQIHSRMNAETDLEGADNSSPIDTPRNGTETEENERNYFSVTEEDIQASIGDSFHTCFGGGFQQKSKYSAKLQELFATEVARRVNQAIDLVSPPSSPRTSKQSGISTGSTISHVEDMVYYIIRILRELVGENEEPPESPDDQESLDSELSEMFTPDQETDVKAQETDVKAQETDVKAQELDVKARATDFKARETDVKARETDVKAQETDVKSQETDVKSQEKGNEDQENGIKDQETDIREQEMDIRDQEADIREQEMDIGGSAMDMEETSLEHPDGCNQDQDPDIKETEETSSEDQDMHYSGNSGELLLQREKTFLFEFLQKLMEHITRPLRTIISDEDINEMAERLRKKTAGIVTFPQTSGNVHIPILKQLDHRFKSRSLLRRAMLFNDEAFEEAVAETLTKHLQKPSRKYCGFGAKIVKILCRESKKISPGCEINTSASHAKVVSQENMLPPPQRKQKCPAVSRMFSSMAKVLKMSITCCTSCSADN